MSDDGHRDDPNLGNVDPGKKDGEATFTLRREVIEDDPLPIPLAPEPYNLKRFPGPNNRRAHWVPKFLEVLALQGQIGIACTAAGIRRQTYLNLAKEDPEFAEQARVAKQDATDRLAYALWKRAHEGVTEEKGIWNTRRDPKTGNITREKVATETKMTYSDVGAIFLLKAWDPETFADRQRVEHSQRERLRDLVIAMARDRGINPEVAIRQMEGYLQRLRERRELGLLPSTWETTGG